MIDPRRVEALVREEAELFRVRHPKSGAAVLEPAGHGIEGRWTPARPSRAMAIKRQECGRFSAQVTELDYAWYLRNA